MSKRIFTKEQIEVLLKNENVLQCSKKAITYCVDFKKKAVQEYNERGLASREIFRNAGLDLEIIGKDTPRETMKRWNKTYRTKGMDKLITENRGIAGRPKKIRDLNDKDKIKRLEIEVTYLKAENAFLAKLRAKRRE